MSEVCRSNIRAYVHVEFDSEFFLNRTNNNFREKLDELECETPPRLLNFEVSVFSVLVSASLHQYRQNKLHFSHICMVKAVIMVKMILFARLWYQI